MKESWEIHAAMVWASAKGAESSRRLCVVFENRIWPISAAPSIKVALTSCSNRRRDERIGAAR